jgi:hypothetical protein
VTDFIPSSITISFFVHFYLDNVICPVSNILPQTVGCAHGFSKGQELHDDFNSVLTRIQDENCFCIHHLKNGVLPDKCAQRYVPYRYFPEN